MISSFVGYFVVGVLLLYSGITQAQPEMEHHHHNDHHAMKMDETGMVMNENADKLPEDCSEIRREYQFEVTAGTEYAKPFPGTTFGFSDHQWQVEPCSRITVTFINQDRVRHQWMVHGLPKYLYDQGMFHMEAAGGHRQSGTFIVPSDDRTYLVHCDIAQHMEKGMKAQLVVGRGSGDLWSVPGVSATFERADETMPRWLWGAGLFCLMIAAGLVVVWKARISR